jgi:uncharacterized protein YggE
MPRAYLRQDVRMTLDITVRGTAEQHHPAERAIVSMTVTMTAPDKRAAYSGAVDIQEPLSAELEDLAERRAVQSWSVGQVRMFNQRSADGADNDGPLVHVGTAEVCAEFTDFEGLSDFLDHWSGVDGVTIDDVDWDVSAKNRRIREIEVRRSAVDDAVAKAQAYSDAVRRGRVVAVQIADPGMLPGVSDGPETGHGSGGSRVTLAPETVVIRVDVDAKFRTD